MALLGSRNDARTWGEATGRRFFVSTRIPQLASLPPDPPRGSGPVAKEESTEQLATTNDGGLKYYLSNCPRNRIRPRPELARNLLDAMRAYATPEHLSAQVVIDDDPPLAGLLLGAGAESRMRIEHFRGQLPGH